MSDALFLLDLEGDFDSGFKRFFFSGVFCACSFIPQSSEVVGYNRKRILLTDLGCSVS